MTWRSLEEVYLKESALKEVPLLPRQQVYKEASAEEVIKLIKDLDSQGLLQSGEDLEVVKKFLARKPFAEAIADLNLMLLSGSSPPTLTATDISLPSLENSFARFLS